MSYANWECATNSEEHNSKATKVFGTAWHACESWLMVLLEHEFEELQKRGTIL